MENAKTEREKQQLATTQRNLEYSPEIVLLKNVHTIICGTAQLFKKTGEYKENLASFETQIKNLTEEQLYNIILYDNKYEDAKKHIISVHKWLNRNYTPNYNTKNHTQEYDKENATEQEKER